MQILAISNCRDSSEGKQRQYLAVKEYNKSRNISIVAFIHEMLQVVSEKEFNFLKKKSKLITVLAFLAHINCNSTDLFQTIVIE